MDVGEAAMRPGSAAEVRACVSSLAVNAVMDEVRGVEVTELKRESRRVRVRQDLAEIEVWRW